MISPFGFRAILTLGLCLGQTVAVSAQDGPFKVEPLSEAAPAELTAAFQDSLGGAAYRVLDGQGKPFLDIWLRKAIPAKHKPAGPDGAILLPFLEVGECLGVLKFHEEGHDYRDQPILDGVYTVRYGLQPVNGDHLGVSVFRDYGMLLVAEDDKELVKKTQDELDELSAEAAASNHPAVFILMAAPGDKPEAAIVRDEAEDRWGVVLPLSLSVSGESEPVVHPVQLIFFGHGPI